MSEGFSLIGIGAVLTIIYLVFGIGTARAVSKMKNTDFSLLFVFMWPVVLFVIAASGTIEE